MLRPLKYLLITTLFLSFNVHSRIVKEGYFLFDVDKKYLNTFYQQTDLTIDQVDDSGYELYGPDGLGEWLEKLDVEYVDLNDQNKFQRGDDYPTPEKIGEKLQELQARFPEILKLESIGKSVKGRDLWVMKISDNPTVDEVEPEVKYIANMHGNEIASRDVLVKFIEHIAESYGNVQSVTDLIDNSEIHIMPSMNPDGAAMRRRGNANWVDLNRDFPDFTTNDNQNTTVGRAPETKAVMEFQAKRQFALSANFHGGAVCINYPWDTTPSRPPLLDLIIDISKEYADDVSEMRNSSRFEGGIVNGYDWYTINGGMQDWSFYWHGDMQTTIEMHASKWPRYSQIEYYFQEHKNSLFNYLKRVHQGAGFKINEKIQGSVTIFKMNNLQKTSIGTFSFTNGEFYKVLEEGNYEFMIKTEGRGNYYFETSIERGNMYRNGNYHTVALK